MSHVAKDKFPTIMMLLLAARTCNKGKKETNKSNQNKTNQPNKQANKKQASKQKKQQAIKEANQTWKSKQQRQQSIKQVSKQTNRKGQLVALSPIWEIRNKENEKNRLDNIQTYPGQHCHQLKQHIVRARGFFSLAARVDRVYKHDDNIGDKKEWRNVIDRFLWRDLHLNATIISGISKGIRVLYI